MDFIVQSPPSSRFDGGASLSGGFAGLIDALLDSLVGSDEALTGFDERAEVPEEPQTGDETARTAFPAVAAALAATPPVLPGESAPQPVAEPATGADFTSDMVEAVADRIPQYAVPESCRRRRRPVPTTGSATLGLKLLLAGHDAVSIRCRQRWAPRSALAAPNPPVAEGRGESTAVGAEEPGPTTILPASRAVEHRAADTGDATPSPRARLRYRKPATQRTSR